MSGDIISKAAFHSLSKGGYRREHSLSGIEILTSLIAVANAVEAKTTTEDLTQWCFPNGTYRHAVFDALVEFGLNEGAENEYHRPFSAYAQQYRLPKRELKGFVRPEMLINPERYAAIDDDAEVMGAAFIIWYAMNASGRYYSPVDPEDYVERGVPRVMAPLFSAVHDMKHLMRGHRKEADVECELLDLLLPGRLNNLDTTVSVLVPCLDDLFRYDSRFFSLRRKTLATQGIGQNILTEENTPSVINLLSSFAVYHFKSGDAPVAYGVFKDGERSFSSNPLRLLTGS